MSKKKLLLSIRQILITCLKFVVCLSIVLCVWGVFTVHSSSRSSSSLPVPKNRVVCSYNGPPKIAFMFLTRNYLPLDFLWDSFFQNADSANFSIYIHSAPGFVFDELTTKSKFFYGRQLRGSVRVAWGESSMIEAERLLLGEALEDPANQRFVLLSDSCVPLYNFSYIYTYLMSSPRSFVDSFLTVKGGRYNPKMSHVIPKEKWRKGSQWIALVRKHAELIVDDDVILPVFKKHCKCRLPVDPRKGRKYNLLLQKQHDCIPDEHYVQTLLSMSDLEQELERRTVTYTLWNQSKSIDTNTNNWHPVTFSYAKAGPTQIHEIKGINHVYYETEYRTEWCRTNTTFVSCFLFARKFSKGAAMRLLSEGVVGSFDATALFDRQT